MNKTESFFKLIRSKKLQEISDKPVVLAILVKLGLFTKRSTGEEGRFVLVKWKKMGITEQQFRTAKSYILNNGLATVRRTFGGTEFLLIGKSIIDINENETTVPTTGAQRNQNNKKENKKIKQEEKRIIVPQIENAITGSTLNPPSSVTPPKREQDIVIDLYEMARDDVQVAKRLLSLGVV